MISALTLSAEMQWEQLPPMTFTAPGIDLACVLEPAYEIGGDTVDYAMDGHLLSFALVDAMGRGIRAALMSTQAIGVWRNARRNGRDLAACVERASVWPQAPDASQWTEPLPGRKRSHTVGPVGSARNRE